MGVQLMPPPCLPHLMLGGPEPRPAHSPLPRSSFGPRGWPNGDGAESHSGLVLLESSRASFYTPALSNRTCSSVVLSQDPRGSSGGCSGVSFLNTPPLGGSAPLLMKGAFVSRRAGADVSSSPGPNLSLLHRVLCGLKTRPTPFLGPPCCAGWEEGTRRGLCCGGPCRGSSLWISQPRISPRTPRGGGRSESRGGWGAGLDSKPSTVPTTCLARALPSPRF
ncbi:UNVERIFIED_CONTAM: hypothetical protein K2H54_051670 [Gekko kuhli]